MLIVSQFVAEGNPVLTYGIKGDSVIFEDVSTDRNKVKEMVERLNNEKLEEIHFRSFIEDELDR